jgi:hypothetical protein
MNRFGSAEGQGGKKAKACRDSKRLMVVKAIDLKNEKDPKYWVVNVTVSSLKPLNEFSKSLSQNGISTPSVVVTRLGFDEDSDFPKLTFKAMGCLNETMAKSSLKVAEKKDWDFGKDHDRPAISHAKQDLPAMEDKSESTDSGESKVVEGEVVEKVEKPEKTESQDVDDILASW